MRKLNTFREMFSALKSRGIYSDVSTERLFRARMYLDQMGLSSQGATRKSMIFSKRILGDIFSDRTLYIASILKSIWL